MSLPNDNGLSQGTDASTRSGRKRARNSTGNGLRVPKQARPDSSVSTPAPVPELLRDIVAIGNSPRTTSQSQNVIAWSVVDKQNGALMASPGLTKGEKTFEQLAKRILLDYKEGRTSEQISIAIHESGLRGDDLKVMKGNVSATLSSGQAMFEKGPLNDGKKYIWLLKDQSSSPLIMNESLERILATDESETTVGVDTLQGHESGEQHNTTSGRVSAHGNRTAEDDAELNEDEAAALPDTNSVEIARMINNVIASAGQNPPPGIADSPAAALAVEPSRDDHLHRLQQACPPATNRLEEQPARQ